jgi:hypothetical protein
MSQHPSRTRALNIGLETYELETALTADRDWVSALTAAIVVATRVHETAVLQKIAYRAEVVSARLLAEPNERYRGQAAAITWFASRHIPALPLLADADLHQPNPGDIVEVTLSGPVLTADDRGTWTLADGATKTRYRFAAPGTFGAPTLHPAER